MLIIAEILLTKIMEVIMITVKIVIMLEIVVHERKIKNERQTIMAVSKKHARH